MSGRATDGARRAPRPYWVEPCAAPPKLVPSFEGDNSVPRKLYADCCGMTTVSGLPRATRHSQVLSVKKTPQQAACQLLRRRS
jgi:hypothetical protein